MSEIQGPRYKIEREIGRGAFGVVYLARDNLLRRDVALKVMSIPDGLTEDEKHTLSTASTARHAPRPASHTRTW